VIWLDDVVLFMYIFALVSRTLLNFAQLLLSSDVFRKSDDLGPVIKLKTQSS
jgi:hypothetical protein